MTTAIGNEDEDSRGQKNGVKLLTLLEFALHCRLANHGGADGFIQPARRRIGSTKTSGSFGGGEPSLMLLRLCISRSARGRRCGSLVSSRSNSAVSAGEPRSRRCRLRRAPRPALQTCDRQTAAVPPTARTQAHRAHKYPTVDPGCFRRGTARDIYAGVPEQRARHRQFFRRVEKFGDTEVEHDGIVGIAVARNQLNVFRLEIAMHHPSAMAAESASAMLIRMSIATSYGMAPSSCLSRRLLPGKYSIAMNGTPSSSSPCKTPAPRSDGQSFA